MKSVNRISVLLIAASHSYWPAAVAAASRQAGPCTPQKVVDGSFDSKNFGRAAAIDGGVAVIGAPRKGVLGANYGGAIVFEKVEQAWQELAVLIPADAGDNDRVGDSVAISGDTIVVGAPNSDPGGITNAGSAWVYERIRGTWIEVARLVASDPQFGDRFGISVAVDGGTIVVGANEEDQAGSNSGAAYVFERAGGVWLQAQKLRPADLQAGDWLGFACSIESEWIVLGAPSANAPQINSGAAYVFQRTEQGWVEATKLVAWDGEANDFFGGAGAIHGGWIAMGANAEDELASNSGAVYLFEIHDGQWGPRQKCKAPDPSSTMKLGGAVALGPNRLLAGASSDADGITGSGSAYLFMTEGSGEYAFSRKLRAPDAEQNDFLGFAVALSGDTALLGVHADDDNCPPEFPNCDSGSAWFFEVPSFTRGFCFGEDCPCGNDDPARGCVASHGKAATLVACGSGSVTADDLVLRAENLVRQRPALLFRGLDALDGGAGLPFGDGLRCVGGDPRRLGTVFAADDGSATWGPGLATIGGWAPGQTMRFQVLYRDPAGSPCGAGFNTTHGLEAEFSP